MRTAVCLALFAAPLLVLLQTGGPAAPGPLTEGPVERIRGIYLQRSIQTATVGEQKILLTRMTRFRKCGNLRALAQDFNEHIVEVTGRNVDGIGFVAGFVNAIEGCSPATAFTRGPGE
jgi:hypothetical protein